MFIDLPSFQFLILVEKRQPFPPHKAKVTLRDYLIFMCLRWRYLNAYQCA